MGDKKEDEDKKSKKEGAGPKSIKRKKKGSLAAGIQKIPTGRLELVSPLGSCVA
jgi:hypothetical protein